MLRTTDGGATWVSVGPPDVSGLHFRDVEATSARHAVILSVGNGTDSRIYVTDDGGGLVDDGLPNEDRAAFYDCMAFSTPQRGLALSDPVDGAFRLQETTDGGHTWSLVDPSGMPPAGANEFAFAASGTCLTAGQERTTYLASGGEDGPHVLVSQDAGSYLVGDHGATGQGSRGGNVLGAVPGPFARHRPGRRPRQSHQQPGQRGVER